MMQKHRDILDKNGIKSTQIIKMSGHLATLALETGHLTKSGC